MTAATIPSTVLRVAAAWGTTVLSVKNLVVGQSYILGETEGASMAMPDGLTASSIPVRAVATGWELDARGVKTGLLRLRGREEDPKRFVDAPVILVPGDWGLLQYGAFSLFFQFGPAAPPLSKKKRRDLLVGLSIASSVIFHFGLFGLVRAITSPPPIPKPAELSKPEEIAARFGIDRALPEEASKETMAGTDKSGGTGVKDPGARDTKKQGGGKKMAETEGKLGKNGKEDHTELQGEIRNGLGGMSDVLASETGEEIKHTLGTISSVAAALGGLNSANIVLGAGTGTGLKGVGPGGGGTGAGVPFGSGTLNTGWGVGSGGGFGAGAGGPGGKGRGGPGLGGSGKGDGQGNGTGERQVAVQSGAGSGTGGLSPEQIRRVVMAHLGALRACYEMEAERNPSLKGGVSVQWQIAPEGTVSAASLGSSSLGNPRVEGCVVRQVKGWRFPSSAAPSSVNWPFKFGLSGGS
ncbi:MAG TPA: AgmX/PglI C-terminal domain-containing protein [Polyangiaceae bacterium]|nr:AgmX/PglI C-terminal domain-containing protein [Polyangiaceae bacterium]